MKTAGLKYYYGKTRLFNKVFIKYFILFSFIGPTHASAGTRSFGLSTQCEQVFADVDSPAQSTKIPPQKPNVSQFLKSDFLKDLIGKVATSLPSDNPRLLVAKFRQKGLANHRVAAGFFTLFLLILPATAFSQQSLFNVPSAQPTKKHKFFFQEQINLLPKEVVTNTTLDYGLGEGWSLGMSLFNLKAYASETNYLDPDMLVNIEKTTRINPHWSIGVGTQSGYNSGHNPEGLSQFKSFSYLQNMFVLPKDLGKFYLGYYHANGGFSGDKNTDGAMLGLEVPIIKDKLDFMADYLSGTSPISVAVVGLVYTTDSHVQLSAGVQVPSPGSDNDFGAVFEFTIPSF